MPVELDIASGHEAMIGLLIFIASWKWLQLVVVDNMFIVGDFNGRLAFECGASHQVL